MFDQKRFDQAVKAIKHERHYQEDSGNAVLKDVSPIRWMHLIISYMSKATIVADDCIASGASHKVYRKYFRVIAALCIAAMEDQGILDRPRRHPGTKRSKIDKLEVVLGKVIYDDLMKDRQRLRGIQEIINN